MPPTTSEPRTINIGALDPTYDESAPSVTATALVPAISRVTRPSASVTTSRVRAAQPVAQQHAEGGSYEHRGDVDQRAESGDGGSPLSGRRS